MVDCMCLTPFSTLFQLYHWIHCTYQFLTEVYFTRTIQGSFQQWERAKSCSTGYHQPSEGNWPCLGSNKQYLLKWVPRGSVVRCLTHNPGVLGSSRTRFSGFFRGSVLGQDTSEPSLALVKPRKAWIMWTVAVIWLKYC